VTPPDPFRRVEQFFAERDQRTAAELGCPEALIVDGEHTCQRASKARIELAFRNTHIGGLLKAATPILLPAHRRKAVDGGFDIHLSAEEFHDLSAAIDRLREA
jgi:hypothetical protein